MPATLNDREGTRPRRTRRLPVSGLLAVLFCASSLHAQGVATTGIRVRPDTTTAAARAASIFQQDFTARQLGYSRVMEARVETRFGIKKLFRDAGLTYPAAEIFLRIFKRERTLELWVRPFDADRFSLLKRYMICALTGAIGPKRAQGDRQTPEGFYTIDSFNPFSQYHLSLHLDYPNRADRILGSADAPGGDIFIHGGCQTLGCIAVTDASIKELYWIAVEAHAAGQERIPVDIFPARLTEDELRRLDRGFSDRPDLRVFWANLKPGYDYFERYHRPPDIRVSDDGRYVLADPGVLAGLPFPEPHLALHTGAIDAPVIRSPGIALSRPHSGESGRAAGPRTNR